MNDLISYLEDKLSPAEIVELLNEVIYYDEESKETLRKYAIDNNICPMCASTLSLLKWREDRGEHFGFPAYENMSELYCPECGWKED